MTSTKLKLIAAFFMLLDHIAKFLPNIPSWFHWIGRISAPIFFFCMAWGFFYTHDRKKYILRLYCMAIVMGSLNTLITLLHPPVTMNMKLSNNIFVNLLIGAILIWIIDMCKTKPLMGKKLLITFIVIQLVTTFILLLLKSVIDIPNYSFFSNLFNALTANIFMSEGNIGFSLLPVILYYSKSSKMMLARSYILFSLIYMLLYVTDFIGRSFMYIEKMVPSLIHSLLLFIPSILGMEIIPTYHVPWYSMLTDQWMMIFALPFMLLYNDKKGAGYKYFFYIFYPTHIYLLYFIGSFI